MSQQKINLNYDSVFFFFLLWWKNGLLCVVTQGPENSVLSQFSKGNIQQSELEMVLIKR